jgi:serine protease Do
VVLSIDGRSVRDANELRNVVAGINPGKKVEILVVRNGKKLALRATLSLRSEDRIKKSESGEKSTEKPGVESAKKLGIDVSNLTDAMRQQYGIAAGVAGAVITAVDPASQAAAEGLREGDVIREVRIRGEEAKAIASVKDFKAAIGRLKSGDSVMFLIQRGGDVFFAAFRYKEKE